MKLKSALCCVFSLFFFSCSNKTGNELLLNSFIDIKKKDAERFSFDTHNLERPCLMEFYKGRLVFIEYGSEYLMKVFDAQTGKFLQSSAPAGQGPGEYLWITSMYNDNERLMIYDGNLKKISFFSTGTDSLILHGKDIQVHTSSEFITAFKLFPLVKDNYLASGIVKNAHWAVIDSTGHMTDRFDTHPVNPYYQGNLTEDDAAMAYQGMFIVNPSKTKAVYMYSSGIILRFCSINEAGKLAREKELIYEYPQFKENSNARLKSVIFSENNRTSFVDVKGTDNYCFLLYSGLTALEAANEKGAWHAGNKILIYDWDGRPVKAVSLPFRYNMLAVDKQNRLIYLLTSSDEDAADDYSLHVLNLKDEFEYF